MNIEKILELCDETPSDPFKRALKVAIVALKFIAAVDYEETDEPGPCTASRALQSISDSLQ